jgi:hypothetical protein
MDWKQINDILEKLLSVNVPITWFPILSNSEITILTKFDEKNVF